MLSPKGFLNTIKNHYRFIVAWDILILLYLAPISLFELRADVILQLWWHRYAASQYYLAFGEDYDIRPETFGYTSTAVRFWFAIFVFVWMCVYRKGWRTAPGEKEAVGEDTASPDHNVEETEELLNTEA